MPTPTRLTLGPLELVDVRHLYPPFAAGERLRDFALLKGVAIHHDGVIFTAGDRDYSGDTLNEDLDRLDAIYQRAIDQGWGRFPYHFVASPNGRTFYTNDISHYGAHVASRNHELLGIALMGNFMPSHPSDAYLCAAARALLAIWAITGRLYGFRGHREWALPASPTSCPGNTWWTWQYRLLILTTALARYLFPS